MGALQLLSLWLQQLTYLRRSSCPRALSWQSWWRDGCSRWQRGRGRRGRPRWGGPPGWWTSSSGRGVVWALHNAELHNAKLQNCTIAQCTLEKSTIAQMYNAQLHKWTLARCKPHSECVSSAAVQVTTKTGRRSTEQRADDHISKNLWQI